MIKALTTKWAIHPCLILYVISLGVSDMNKSYTDTLHREMNLYEVILSISPIFPITWFTIILYDKIINIKWFNITSTINRSSIYLAVSLLIFTLFYLGETITIIYLMLVIFVTTLTALVMSYFKNENT